jgi:ferredoxin
LPKEASVRDERGDEGTDGLLRGGTTRRGALLAMAGTAIGALALPALEAEEADAAPLTVAQTGWRFCLKCRALFRNPNRAGGCPAGGRHKPRKDLNYVLYATTGVVGGTWVPWFRCTKCAALFLNATGSSEDGVCPKGGKHDDGDGTEFALWFGEPVPVVMDGAWDMCTKCQVLYNWAGDNVGSCPVDALGHAHSGSLTVSIVMIY